MLIDDLPLIKRCLKNDSSAQRALYEMHKRSWFMTCLRYGKTKMEAEDIFQNGLVSVFKDIHQFDISKSKFTTWSNRIMVNAALQFLRKWQRIDKLAVDVDFGLDQVVQEDIYDILSAKELIKLVQNLPDGYRVVFNMFVIEGYKHREIADELKISVNTSKSQLFKAKQFLKKEVELLFLKH